MKLWDAVEVAECRAEGGGHERDFAHVRVVVFGKDFPEVGPVDVHRNHQALAGVLMRAGPGLYLL